MKNIRIAIRPQPTPECVVSLAPAIAALKAQHPGSAVGIVAPESLREASLLLPELDFFSPESENVHADRTIDLFGGEKLETAAESTDWKSYLSCASRLTSGNPYHLVDLLRKAARVETTDVNFELAAPEHDPSLPEALQGPGGLRLALCVSSLSSGALEAALASIAALNGAAEVFLIGTVKDKKISASLVSQWDGKLSVHDLCGRHSLAMNAAVLHGCDISIVGHGLHSVISSGYGTFTICVDENPTEGPLLYPYGHGHLILQKCTDGDFSATLAPFLNEIVNHALSANNGNVPTLEQWQEFADGKIFSYLGKIRMLATQRIETRFKSGGSFTELYLRPLLFTGAELYEVMHTFYRLLWEHSLSGRTITTYDLQILHQDTARQLCDLLKPMEQLYELGNFGRTYSVYVKESLAGGDIDKAKHESMRLQEVEELVQALALTQPQLQPLYGFHAEKQRLMENDSPILLAGEMAELFSGLQERVLVMLDLAKSLFHTVFENESTLAAGSSEEAESNG